METFVNLYPTMVGSNNSIFCRKNFKQFCCSLCHMLNNVP